MADRVPIDADMTAGELHDVLARIGAKLMPRALGALERGTIAFKPQGEAGVTYADKISKNETRIDWSKPSKPVHNHIRGLSPFPGAWFETESTRVKVLRSTLAQGSGAPGTVLDDQLTVACGEGAVRLLELQRAGRQAMKAEEFLRGTPMKQGSRLS
jgi:methionyl-tRNA formyltransferase